MASAEQTLTTDKATRVFVTTRWSVVLQMRGPSSATSAKALQELCRSYWYPLYGFARRRGLAPHDAEDLIQSFFTFLLEKEVFARADPERGRFRTFLLCSLRNFQANERARQECQKRGGNHQFVSFEELQAEARYEAEPSSDLSPERLYDQKWAASLLERVLDSLQSEYTTAGKGEVFELLRPLVWGAREPTTYHAVGRQLGMTEGAVKVAVHRLRARFRERLRDEVTQTVDSPEAVDDELRHLLAALTV